jgi:hypothetical protein
MSVNGEEIARDLALDVVGDADRPPLVAEGGQDRHDLLVEHVARSEEEEEQDQREDHLRQNRRQRQGEGEGIAVLLDPDALDAGLVLALGDLVNLSGGLLDPFGDAAQLFELPADFPPDLGRAVDPGGGGHRKPRHPAREPRDKGADDERGREPRGQTPALELAADRAEDELKQDGEDHGHQEVARIGQRADEEHEEDADHRPARRERRNGRRCGLRRRRRLRLPHGRPPVAHPRPLSPVSPRRSLRAGLNA